MKVCVIVPVYDIGPLLCDTILSIVDQTVTAADTGVDLTLHLVFDGCPLHETNSAILADLLAGTETCNIVISYGANGGVSHARNIGIKRLLAEPDPTDFVIFFDADDLMPPNYIARCLAHYEAEKPKAPNLGWVYLDQVGFGKSRYVLRYPNGFDACRFATTNLSQPTSMLHMDVLRAGVTFDENLEAGLEDYEFWVQAIRAGFVGSYCSESYCNYRLLSGSRSSVNRANDAYTRSYVMAKHAPFFEAKAVLQQMHETLPTFLHWSASEKRFQDARIEGNPERHIALETRETRDLQVGFFARLATINPTYDEFYRPRVARILSIGDHYAALRSDALLDLHLKVEESLRANDVVRFSAEDPENSTRRIVGYVISMPWLLRKVGTFLTQKRTGYDLVTRLANVIMQAKEPRCTTLAIDEALTSAGASDVLKNDPTLSLLRAFDTLLGDSADASEPQQTIRVCAARRANFEDMFASLFGCFPVVPAFGTATTPSTGLVFRDPEAAPIVQSILDTDDTAEAKIFWFGADRIPDLQGAQDIFRLDLDDITWKSPRNYAGALIDPPKDVLKRIRSRLLGLDRVVVVGDVQLFVCLAAAVGAECEISYVPRSEAPLDVSDIEAVIAFQGATSGIYVPSEARDLYRAMGVPAHLLEDAEESDDPAGFVMRQLSRFEEAASALEETAHQPA